MKTKYYVYPIDRALITISKGNPITMQEARKIINEDVKRARNYFGTAVTHWKGELVKITARRDERSALWGWWRLDKC